MNRQFNAMPLLAYWDIYKNYYANKQEKVGAVVHNSPTVNKTVDDVRVYDVGGQFDTVPFGATTGTGAVGDGGWLSVGCLAAPNIMVDAEDIMLYIDNAWIQAIKIYKNYEIDGDPTQQDWKYTDAKVEYWGKTVEGWRYANANDIQTRSPKVQFFDLKNLDRIRRTLLRQDEGIAQVYRNGDVNTIAPLSYILEKSDDAIPIYAATMTQEGLGIKTYQSDMFNNWLETESIDGAGGVNELSAVDVSNGKLTMDSLNLAKKVYEMMNAIQASGGTYDDYQDAVWNHDRAKMIYAPVYCGGLSKELIFQEVIATAQTDSAELGQLAGRGKMSGKHKGGYVTVKVDEPCYIMSIASLTPRIDYSQGNKWDVNLRTIGELHAPKLDGIGFEDRITDAMAWWDSDYSGPDQIEYKSAGKVPAWQNYMSDVNEILGNFADEENEMFMVLARRYENGVNGIKDLTTYIDPSKFNYIFAQTSLDAMNFWFQVRKDVTVRRKMSAKVMPNV